MEERSAQFRRLLARLAHERRMAWTDARITVASLTMYQETAHEAGLNNPVGLTMELCERLISGGAPDVAGSARFFKAVALWEQGLHTQATNELCALESHPTSAYLAAEIAEFWVQVGDCARALDWYTRALQAPEPTDDSERKDRRQAARGRSALRTRMGLDPDDLDYALFLEDLGTQERLRRPPCETPVLTPFFPRREVAQAEAQGLLGLGCGADIYHLRSELCWQLDAVTKGITRRHLVPMSVAEMRLLRELPPGDAQQIGTREFYLSDLAERGQAVSWPPDDSAPCWCESGFPYACCCGRPRH